MSEVAIGDIIRFKLRTLSKGVWTLSEEVGFVSAIQYSTFVVRVRRTGTKPSSFYYSDYIFYKKDEGYPDEADHIAESGKDEAQSWGWRRGTLLDQIAMETSSGS